MKTRWLVPGTLIALMSAPASAQTLGDVAGGNLTQNINTLQEEVARLKKLLEPKVLFVTSTTHTGNLGGLEGADAICQGLADAPDAIVPPGEYVALLGGLGVHAASRITPSIGPYVMPDGVPIAANFAALFNTRIENFNGGPDSATNLINVPILNEKGTLALDIRVWTGMNPDGTSNPGTFACSSWTTTADDSTRGTNFFPGNGFFESRDGRWLTFDTGPCTEEHRFYCVQR